MHPGLHYVLFSLPAVGLDLNFFCMNDLNVDQNFTLQDHKL